MYSKVPSGDQMCGARVQSSSLNSSEGNSLNVNVLFPFLKDYYNQKYDDNDSELDSELGIKEIRKAIGDFGLNLKKTE